MASDPLTFAATLEKFRIDTKEKLDALVRQSAQDVIGAANTAQPSVKGTGGAFQIGKVPVDTGTLRNSLATSVNGGAPVIGGDAYLAVIAGAEAGDIIDAVWTARYAAYIEYGTSRIAPRFFVRANIERWQAIVDENARLISGVA